MSLSFFNLRLLGKHDCENLAQCSIFDPPCSAERVMLVAFVEYGCNAAGFRETQI